MDRYRVARNSVLLIGFVACSSALGLAPVMFTHGWEVYGMVWGDNVWSDVVFVGGSMAACVVAVVAARHGPTWLGGVVGLVLNYLVYAASCALLGSDFGIPEEGAVFVGTNPFELVVRFGWAGLVFCALAPIQYYRVMRGPVGGTKRVRGRKARASWGA